MPRSLTHAIPPLPPPDPGDRVAVVAGWLVMLRSLQFAELILFTVLPVLLAETVLNQTGTRRKLLWICATGLIALALVLLA